MIQSAEQLPARLAIKTCDVAAMIGKSERAARRMLAEMAASGLARKGRGRGTCYDVGEFMRHWAAMDFRS